MMEATTAHLLTSSHPLRCSGSHSSSSSSYPGLREWVVGVAEGVASVL